MSGDVSASVPAEAVLGRDDRDIVKAQLIRRIHGVRSISDMTVAQADMALTQAGDVIDIVLAAAVPVLLAGERERAWDKGHKRGYSDGYDDNGNGYEHDPDVEYTPEGNPYRIARSSTEGGETNG